VASCLSTAFEAVILTISGTTITVESGTKATATLAGNIGGFAQLLPVASGFVLCYTRDSLVQAIRAVSVSGTTPTIGAEVALASAYISVPAMFISGSVVRMVSSDTSNIYIRPYTLSGTTLTPGTAATPLPNGSSTVFRTRRNGNGNLVIQYYNGSNPRAAVVKLTGTVEVATDVLVGTSSSQTLGAGDMLEISASKTLFLYTPASGNSYANIITDTGGTVSVGTELVRFLAATTSNLDVVGGIARVVTSSSFSYSIQSIDCNTASPTLVSQRFFRYNTGMATISTSSYLNGPAIGRLSTSSGYYFNSENTTGQNSITVSSSGLSRRTPPNIIYSPTSGVAGATPAEFWSAGAGIQRLEAV
jgi:hypothetical protein